MMVLASAIVHSELYCVCVCRIWIGECHVRERYLLEHELDVNCVQYKRSCYASTGHSCILQRPLRSASECAGVHKVEGLACRHPQSSRIDLDVERNATLLWRKLSPDGCQRVSGFKRLLRGRSSQFGAL